MNLELVQIAIVIEIVAIVAMCDRNDAHRTKTRRTRRLFLVFHQIYSHSLRVLVTSVCVCDSVCGLRSM